MFQPQAFVLWTAGNILSSEAKEEEPGSINHNKMFTLRDKHLVGLSIRWNPSDVWLLMNLKMLGFSWKPSTKSSKHQTTEFFISIWSDNQNDSGEQRRGPTITITTYNLDGIIL